jgi:DNA-directed RNA polymerase subunit RPC12/RpoP
MNYIFIPNLEECPSEIFLYACSRCGAAFANDRKRDDICRVCGKDCYFIGTLLMQTEVPGE